MKIGLRLLLAVSLVAAPTVSSAAPSRYIHLNPRNAPPIYLPGESIGISIDLPKNTGSQGTVEIRDYQDRPICAKQWTPSTPSATPEPRVDSEASDAVTSAGSLWIQISGSFPGRQTIGLLQWDRFEAFGVFRVKVTLLDSAGHATETDETTFARIPNVSLQTPRPESPFGIGAYYAMRFTPEELAVASRIQQLMGAAWDRDELLWDIVEPEQGKWTWERTDRTVRAAREHNFLILGLLDYWGKWAKPFTDDGYSAYSNYVKQMVERYKPNGLFAREEGWTDGYGIRHWEIWNEPATFWSGSGDQFGRLLKVAHETARSADPECRVFFSEAGATFNAAAVRVAGLDSFEGITPHYYCPPRSPESGEMDRTMKLTVEDFGTLGVTGRPFWVSEFGWPSTMDPGQMREQASYLVRSYVYGFAAGMQKLFWYNFVNDGRDKSASHFGLINREDWTPRLGFGAYAAMVHFLEGARYRSQVEIVRPARIFVFEKGNGSVAVLWSSGATGTLSVSVPGMSHVFDMMGNPVAAGSGDAGTPGRRKVLHIPLRLDPVYLESKSLGGEALRDVLNGGIVQGISPAEVRIEAFVGPLSAKPPVRIDVRNVGRHPLEGTVRLQPPQGWTMEPGTDSSPVGLIGGGNSAITHFVFTSLRPSPDNRYSFLAEFRDSKGNRAVAEAVLAESVAVYGKPVIDGKMDDWNGVPVVHLDTSDRAVGLVPYMDWNLSTDVATMWDESSFYFLGKVRDNVSCQPRTGSTIWEGDSFQIAFDCRCDRTQKPGPDSRGLYLYGLAHTPNGEETWTWSTLGHRADRAAPEIRFAFSSSEKDVYIYEAAIPKALLVPLELKAGARFGFSVLLNDDDGGGRRGWLELTPGIGTGYQPGKFLEWTLVPRP